MENKNVAKIVLLNKKKEFLLQLRDDNPQLIYPGEWVLFGGEIEPGEDPLRGIEREVSEELPDCAIKDIQFIGRENILLKRYNLECHLRLFKGKIEEDIRYINCKLTEGQKASYFKLRDLDLINTPTKESIYRNLEKILL